MEREAIRSHELFRTRLRLAWCFESTSNEPTFQQPKEAATIRAHQNRHASKFGVHFSILISYTWTLPLTYLVLGVKQGIAKILHHRGSNPGTNPCQSGEMVLARKEYERVAVGSVLTKAAKSQPSLLFPNRTCRRRIMDVALEWY